MRVMVVEKLGMRHALLILIPSPDLGVWAIYVGSRMIVSEAASVARCFISARAQPHPHTACTLFFLLFAPQTSQRTWRTRR